MLRFILGRAGTGKTTAVWQAIRERAAAGKRSLLLVPEQFASTADLTGYLQLGDELHSLLKVCSFRTLTGMLEDAFGGGALLDISDAGRMVLMRRTLSQLGDAIVFFHRSRRSAVSASCTLISWCPLKWLKPFLSVVRARGFPASWSSIVSRSSGSGSIAATECAICRQTSY